jgi:hypothetical protein
MKIVFLHRIFDFHLIDIFHTLMSEIAKENKD